MRILLTNDDGIHAPGIHALHAALRECGHEVHVVAPLKENSGVSASLTLRGRLHVYDVEEDGLVGQAVDGTPADCVKLALTTLLRDAPDLVVAGLNNGGNLGTDVFIPARWAPLLKPACSACPPPRFPGASGGRTSRRLRGPCGASDHGVRLGRVPSRAGAQHQLPPASGGGMARGARRGHVAHALESQLRAA